MTGDGKLSLAQYAAAFPLFEAKDIWMIIGSEEGPLVWLWNCVDRTGSIFYVYLYFFADFYRTPVQLHPGFLPAALEQEYNKRTNAFKSKNYHFNCFFNLIIMYVKNILFLNIGLLRFVVRVLLRSNSTAGEVVKEFKQFILQKKSCLIYQAYRKSWLRHWV